MGADVLQKVTIRNAFYKDGYRKSVIAFLFSMIVNIIMGSLLIYIITNPPSPRYFATSIDGRITPIIPLNARNQTDAQIYQWSTQAAVAAFTFNFVNYRQELEAASGFYTAEGWRQFQTALQNSGMLDLVRLQKLVVSAVPTGAPQIVKQGILSGGLYGWRVQIPLFVNLQNSSNFYSPKNFMVTLLIVRVSTLNSPRGIGIQQFLVSEAGQGAA
ncbi:MAG: type IVB secretion system apparatus protein IcmL/DotI [Legionellaceae bacterium]|nr:type IVB secretion system apparatus protein IcmL/DotI [Legionellaceae bacterium]